MDFEWDPVKSALNEAKHGISFDEATELWGDADMVVVEVERGGETRWVGIARGLGSYWVVVYTLRDDAVRIISVRRATKKEASTYDRLNG